MSRIKIFFILLPLLNYGQLTVLNPSFECSYFDGQAMTQYDCDDTDPYDGQGATPLPWDECMPTPPNLSGSFTDYLTPDRQPGIHDITLAPSDGENYLGLGHRPDNGHQEGVSQELSAPMIANNCPYSFTIDLANGLTSWNDFFNSTKTTIGELQIFGGFNRCDNQGQLLWSSGPITNENWQTYNIEFTPNDNYSHIILVCQKIDDPESRSGYILVDNITPIFSDSQIDFIGPSEVFCLETFQIEAVHIGDTGSWNATGPGNIQFDNKNISNPTIDVNLYGTYEFTYTTCSGDTSFVVDMSLPSVSIEPETIYCSLETEIDAFSDIQSGNWSTNSDNIFIIENNDNTASIIADEYGSYDIEFTSCGVSDIATIVFESGEPYIIASDSEDCVNYIDLSVVTLDQNIGLWEQIAGPSVAEIENVYSPSTQVTVTDFGIYTFGITSCDTMVMLDVEIGLPCPLEIPNTFSPNNDGVNDSFIIPGFSSDIYNRSIFYVYNRWGEVVYRNFNYGFDGQWWSGQTNHSLITEINPNAKSDIVNDGTYYYTLEVGHTNSDYPDESYSGAITIF